MFREPCQLDAELEVARVSPTYLPLMVPYESWTNVPLMCP